MLTPSFPHKLHPVTGIIKERLSQLALYAKTPTVTYAGRPPSTNGV